MISETKFAYRMDRNTSGGGMVLYVRKNIPFRKISFENNDKNLKHFFVEISLRKEKRLISCSYNPNLGINSKYMPGEPVRNE